MSLLLEMFSNIIQYQYVGNAHLVYAIVRRQEVRYRCLAVTVTVSVLP